MIPEWRVKEIEAEKVNRLPAVNGMCKWKCETCGKEWTEPEDKEFDRTKDTTNWPVQCLECNETFMKSLEEKGIKCRKKK